MEHKLKIFYSLSQYKLFNFIPSSSFRPFE